MKRTFYTMLLVTALSLPAGYASADSLGLGSTLSGQVGVGTPITGNTRVQTNTRTNAQVGTDVDTRVDTRTRTNYRSDSNERARRDQSQRDQNQMDSRSQITTGSSSSVSAPGSFYSANDLDQNTVIHIQKTLNERGYNVGRADGRWGNATASQLRRYEQSQGLAASSGTNINAQSLQQLGVNFDAGARVNTINPAAGSRNIPPSVKAGVTGSTSYNQ